MAELQWDVRRSPRRHGVTRSLDRERERAASVGASKPKSPYDYRTNAWLRQQLESRGVAVKPRALKRDLIELLVEGDQEKTSPVSPPSLDSVNQSSSIQLVIPSLPSQENTSEANMPAQDVDNLVLWRSPIQTAYHFSMECGIQLQSLVKLIQVYWRQSLATLLIFLLMYVVQAVDGPHSQATAMVQKTLWWWLWWIGLGILSSVGLGTGLHTFLLYLGPHIAAVTLAAWNCMSVDFPEPPYPDEIVCPTGSPHEGATMSIWTIMSKVRMEAIMWGAGTAIGELPPYFMARAARLAGSDMDPELEEALAEADESLPGRAKKLVHHLIQKVGFWGIFLCASIPNPLFDLAGITCGHFLVPFSTFFGATLLGKAIVKMHIQKFSVIFMFSKEKVELLVRFIGSLPVIGETLQQPFREYLDQQKAKLHHKQGDGVAGGGSLIQKLYGLLVVLMLLYFTISIVNSFAQRHAKRSSNTNNQSDITKTD